MELINIKMHLFLIALYFCIYLNWISNLVSSSNKSSYLDLELFWQTAVSKYELCYLKLFAYWQLEKGLETYRVWEIFLMKDVFLNYTQHTVVGKLIIASKKLLIWPEKRKCGQAVETGVELSCNWFLFTSNPATDTTTSN